MVGKRLLAGTVAAAYLLLAAAGADACRFSCAQDLTRTLASAPAHADNDGSCCHPHERSQHHGRQASSCMVHADNIAALLPATITLTKTPMLVAMIPVMDIEIPLAQLRAFRENHDPPLTVSQVVDQSSLSPRAPPSLLAVL